MGWETLAVRVRAGDPDAFAELYDELAGRVYGLCLTLLRDPDEAADAMHDVFVVAVQRIGQLRDPERLVPWMFAIARHLCFRRIEQRRRAVPVGEPHLDIALDAADDSADDDISAVVWAAAAGLNERDRTLLYLNTTQGLDGDDLAAAVGVVHANPYSLLHRAKQQLRRAIDVLYVAKVGRRDCPTLDAILEQWDGTLTPLLRKRIGRHLDDCATCQQTKSRAQSSAAVAAALSATAAHADTLTAAEVLDIAARRPASTEPWQPNGFPPPIDDADRRRRRLVVVLTAAAVGALLLVVAIAVDANGDSHAPKPNAVHVLDAHTQRHAKGTRPARTEPSTTTSAPRARSIQPGPVTTLRAPTVSTAPDAPAIAVAPPVTTITPRSTPPVTSPHSPPTTIRPSPPTTQAPAPPTTAPHPPTTPPKTTTTLPDT